MPHIHNEPGQHDFTTSAFIIRTDGPEPMIMLHLHRKLNMLLQFGGHIELDESPWRGLLRELREEIGYEPDQLSVLQPPQRLTLRSAAAIAHPLPFLFNTHPFNPAGDYKHSDLTYAVITAEAPRLAIAPGESSLVRTFTLAQLADVSPDDIYEETRESARFALEHAMHDWEPVPATAWPA